MQQGDRPSEPGQVHQPILPEHQGGAQEAHRDRTVLGGGQAQELAPVLLLKGIKRGENGAEHGDGDHEDARDGDRQRLACRHPLDECAAQAEEGRVEDDAGEQRTRRAAPGTVRPRKPFVEGQEPELRAEADQQQKRHEEPHRFRHGARRGGKIGKGEAVRLPGEQQEARAARRRSRPPAARA